MLAETACIMGLFERITYLHDGVGGDLPCHALTKVHLQMGPTQRHISYYGYPRMEEHSVFQDLRNP